MKKKKRYNVERYNFLNALITIAFSQSSVNIVFEHGEFKRRCKTVIYIYSRHGGKLVS